MSGVCHPNGTGAATSKTPLLGTTREKKTTKTTHALKGHTRQRVADHLSLAHEAWRAGIHDGQEWSRVVETLCGSFATSQE